MNSKNEPYHENKHRKLLAKKCRRVIEEKKVEAKQNCMINYNKELFFSDEHSEENEFNTKIIYDIFQEKKSNEFYNEYYEEEINDDNLYFNKIKTKKPFKVIYPEIHLFTKAEFDLEESFQTKFDFSVRKRSKEKLPKFLQKHNIRAVMKKRFINTYLIDALKKKLKDAGYNTFFEKLPQSFVRNVSKRLNNKIMRKTLGEILKEKEIYEKENKTNYKHNFTLVKEIEKDGNPELNLILNTKICHFFDEYLNSEEFLIIERNRIKESKKEQINDYYFQKYIYLLKNWNKFCLQ